MDLSILLRKDGNDLDCLSFAEASRIIQGSPHVSTINRWSQRGVRGTKLPTVVVGGRRFIRRIDLLNFLAVLNGVELPKDDREERQSNATSAAVDVLLGRKTKRQA